MNRYILITAGIMILLSVVALWIYLIAYGAPEQPREVFANLGIFKGSDGTVRVLEEVPQGEDITQLALGSAQLEQLTTRAVAGFVFTSNDTVRYVERGTGYVYEIELLTETEKQLSLITVPQTTEAVFSPEGGSVALYTDENGVRRVKILDLLFREDTEESLSMLQQGAQDVAFKNEETLYYAVEANGMTLGYTYDVAKESATQVLTVPLTGVEMLWGSEGNIYTYSKPAAEMDGYLYQVVSGVLKPIQNGGLGLVSLVLNDDVIYSVITNGVYATKMASGGDVYDQGVFMLQEKCTPDPLQERGAWCAAPLGSVPASFVEEWYKGELVSEDQLWLSDLPSGKSSLKADLSKLARRAIDVNGIAVSERGDNLILRNKIDGALWIYRPTPSIPQ
jgi:hypothetical protein